MGERLMWPLYRENARSRSKAHRDPNPDARRWRTWTPATQHFGRWNQCLDVNVLYTLTVSSLITVLAPRGYNGSISNEAGLRRTHSVYRKTGYLSVVAVRLPHRLLPYPVAITLAPAASKLCTYARLG